MSDVAIRVEGLSKLFHIGGKQEQYKTLRETLVNVGSAPARMLRSVMNRRNGRRNSNDTPSIWALKDVSFEIPRGEATGIIGRNGAGKSTLLKILSRITEPTAGFAELHGRVGSLLEVGTGFHPELTGRENIYLNGGILGMRQADITRKFDEIVDFAEVEEFIDTPVKHYSSGMYLRLAFAVAAHLEPEILLVDEVLAVGDLAFQKKCLGKMEDVAGAGRTVLFVSHNMGAVEGLCKNVVWLDKGKLVTTGASSEVVSRYFNAMSQGELLNHPSDPIQLRGVVLKNRAGQITTSFSPGDDIEVEIHYEAAETFPNPLIYIIVVSRFGSLFAANMILDGKSPPAIEGQGTIACRFKSVPLLPQTYFVRIAIKDSPNRRYLVAAQEVMSFQVTGRLADCGLEGERADVAAKSSVPLVLPYEWRFPDGAIVPVRVQASDET